MLSVLFWPISGVTKAIFPAAFALASHCGAAYLRRLKNQTKPKAKPKANATRRTKSL